uniref:Interferon alpha-inducible protein 6 n=1 Tax=Callorhinchus milii TaxID=7868 RepID=A0A4W3HN47_CALMI
MRPKGLFHLNQSCALVVVTWLFFRCTAGAAAYGGPLIVGALGFTGKGIAAKSFASVMMKVSATLGGGGVARGGMVAILQSLGATGSTYGWLGTGAQSGYQIFQRFFCRGNEKSKKPSSSYSSD